MEKVIKSNAQKDDIMNDLYDLQNCPTKKLFAKASELFLTKWNNQTVPKQGSKMN